LLCCGTRLSRHAVCARHLRTHCCTASPPHWPCCTFLYGLLRAFTSCPLSLRDSSTMSSAAFAVFASSAFAASVACRTLPLSAHTRYLSGRADLLVPIPGSGRATCKDMAVYQAKRSIAPGCIAFEKKPSLHIVQTAPIKICVFAYLFSLRVPRIM